jgi:hypothetical protein
MSPSEFDLRAALHDGDGENINVDRIIAGARARAAERRTRIATGAAIVLVVAGAGVGGTYLAHNSGTSAGSNSNADAIGGAAHRAAGGGSNAVNGNQAALPSKAGVSCPATTPRYLLPGGGSPGQFGASGPLFRKPVTSVVVCAYGDAANEQERDNAQPGRLDLADGQARQLAASLESAAKTPTPTECSDLRRADQFAIIGLAADGSRVGTVTATLSEPTCGSQVTNGTAVRYGWTPPTDLRAVLLALKPAR